MTATVSVVVATYRRPDHVRSCLEHLVQQSLVPTEIVVVDSSPDDLTHRVVEEFTGVRYLRNERGIGTTATSRRIGVAATTGTVIAFLDDDALADRDWVAEHARRYEDATVAGVAGRALNGEPGEELEGVEQIGRFLPDGTLTGNFAADPGHDVDVDHALGANMSFRRAVLDEIGGIEDHYPGTCLREETDPALRMTLAGHRMVFAPTAIVRHVPGPYAKGNRFDLRYTYYGERNHLVLLSRTAGVRSTHFRGYLKVASGAVAAELDYARQSLISSDRDARGKARGAGRGLTRAAARTAGIFSGGLQVTRLHARARQQQRDAQQRSHV